MRPDQFCNRYREHANTGVYLGSKGWKVEVTIDSMFSTLRTRYMSCIQMYDWELRCLLQAWLVTGVRL